ncbi:NUDIX domain-containing protein [Phycicoccus sp. BSK3Z-2]|uniref:NUDIX domain-containing protein n=1 Tax=Phycicoccus avicenniae TaxID=2828860 RepID=A0A941HZW3_9MICO|nr:NUDIX domain-containing protein [Phycicoccus avicenniae]MBR7743407.1 NUDIX domain-containing protein [Phycicoccus avicenniae]
MLERARTWLADGSPEGAVPEPAATVMLVRDGAGGPEVYVQRRAATMAFAPSMVVFPGGRVDPQDAALDPGTPGVAEVAAQMGVGPAEAASLVAAAVREVEEECGVRVPVEGLAVRGHWVTPAFETRRYDTWFLAAAMPDGQAATETSGESDGGGWVRPADTLERSRAGEVRLMPPQVWALEALAGFDTVAAFLADRPRVALVAPVLVEDGDDVVLVTRLP